MHAKLSIMKIENKIILSSILNVALMVLIGIFAFQTLNLMLTKLRFVEIADDLNASFLEMRLSEKNYFLYNDPSALHEIREKIKSAMDAVNSSRTDITRAVGAGDLSRLNEYISDYAAAINGAEGFPKSTRQEARIRASGKKLREFSDEITRLERQRVNEIIASSKKMMLISFLGIIISAVIVSHFLAQKMLRSLRMIEDLAKSIGEGKYQRIEGDVPNDELGSVIKAVNSMSDELKNREDEITQSKKLASLGVLTAGVAHEITNPVNNISMIAQTYQEVYDSMTRQDRIEFMRKVESEADRIKEIVRSLLDFSKPKKADLRIADLNAVINNSLRLTQNALDVNKIEVHTDLKKNLPPVYLDEHQMLQVFVNLIVNASQAMPEGGWLNIKSRLDRERNVVMVCITDTGTGIPPEYLPHVFDPFFSTKGVGGTGLGLSVSYGIIKNHCGNIKVDSGVGTGTTFTVELPVPEKKEQEVFI